MEILLPKGKKRELPQLINRLTLAKPMKPFEDLSLAFIKEIPRAIIKKKMLSDLELRQLAHWTDKANLKKIYQSYEARRQGRIWLPRGLVLHFTPANIDSLFIYSWLLSLLIGNSNIIRLSRNRTPQIILLLDMLNSILGQKRFKPIRERNLIVSYGHEQAITEELSQYCRVRVIWGGDEAIKQIRAVALPPMATEVVFADRFSMAALKASAVLDASAREINKLARNIYYDTFFFTQRGCFSPKLVFWIGKNRAIDNAKNRFWAAVEKLASQEKIDWQKGIGIARMSSGYRYAAEGMADKLSTASTGFPYRIHIQKFKKNLREIHSGGGLFLEAEKPSLTEILQLLVSKDQTLSVYGFSKKELQKFASQLSGLGLDRIVPIGQTFDFQAVWDGYDLFTYYTREVTVS